MAAPPANATLKLEPFTINIPDAKLQEFQTLLKLSPLPPPTYEGTKEEFGVTREWMSQAKSEWERFDWRATEHALNNIPGAQHYTTQISTWTLHFVAHFSASPTATPLLLPHGWPGDFTEYLPLLATLQARHPGKFHIIIPSLPGYTFSSRPPTDRDTSLHTIASLLHALMTGLGFARYVVAAGDIGAFLAQHLSGEPACRGVLLTLYNAIPPLPVAADAAKIEREAAARRDRFHPHGSAYMMMHATRPSTIAHCVSASPVALLAWVGEKMRDWMQRPAGMREVLQRATLWWLTETFATSVYPYRELVRGVLGEGEGVRPRGRWGYAWYPWELSTMTRAEVERERAGNGVGGRLVWCRWHEEGGHWPALEVPEEFARDVVEFVEALEREEAEEAEGKGKE